MVLEDRVSYTEEAGNSDDDGRHWGDATKHPRCDCDGENAPAIVRECRLYRSKIAHSLWDEKFIPIPKNPEKSKIGTPSHKPAPDWADTPSEASENENEARKRGREDEEGDF